MRIKHMFKKTVRDIRGEEQENIPEVPDNLMRKCNACKAAVFVDEVKQNQYICPHCGNYFHVPAYRRIKLIADRKSFVEWDAHMEEQNPLQYRGYEEKLQGLREKTGLDEAVVTGKCTIKGTPVALGVCDCRFMMSSMGEVVGEKITRAFERATEEKLPVILYICSGGARMQEGLVSLMQMAKTSMAIRKHSDAGLLYVPVLTDPTYKKIEIKPAMIGDLRFVSSSVKTPYGEVCIDWERNEDEILVSVVIPPNTEAVLLIPGQERKEIGSGNYQFRYVACEK